jgi:hypothetical protein
MHKELRRQNNIDSISEIALSQLENEATLSKEKVSEDRSTRFFNISQDISEEEMQEIW